MFKEARERAGKKPKVLISDGAHNFHEAYVKEYWSRYKEDRPEHIRDVRFEGQTRNIKMERQNGEVRPSIFLAKSFASFTYYPNPLLRLTSMGLIHHPTLDILEGDPIS